MAAQTPEEFIRSIWGSGLLVVRGDATFFIPLKTMNECMLPKPFQKDYRGVSGDYFEKAGAGAEANGQVYTQLDRLLGEFRLVDGVRQAIWISEKESNAGKTVSKSNSGQVLFQYGEQSKKILVDMSKGGKPSSGM